MWGEAKTKTLVGRGFSVAVMLACNSCALFKDAYRVDPVVVPSKPNINWFMAHAASPFVQGYRTLTGAPAIQTIVLDDYRFPGEKDPTPGAYTKASCGGEIVVPLDPKARDRRCRDDRNRLAAEVVSLSNDMCVQHMSGFVSQQALNELVLGSVTLGLTGGGSVIASAATELSAAATGVGGLRTLVNDTVYYKQLTPALVKRAIAERNQLLTTISAKLQVNSLDDVEMESLRLACKADCPTGKRPGAPDGETPAGCANRCDAQTVFPCPHVLPADIIAARKEAEAAKAKEDKAQNDQDKARKTPSATAKLEAAVREKLDAVEQKTNASDNVARAEEDQPYCRDWKEYSIDAVLADLKTFHDSCSFYHVLGLASDEIQKSADAINKDLDGIYKSAAKDAAAGNKPASSGSADSHKTETKPASGNAASKKL